MSEASQANIVKELYEASHCIRSIALAIERMPATDENVTDNTIDFELYLKTLTYVNKVHSFINSSAMAALIIMSNTEEAKEAFLKKHGFDSDVAIFMHGDDNESD